jgi:hypothetical protein
MVSGVTKISVGLGWKWFWAVRRKPNPFSDISRYPEPNSVALLLELETAFMLFFMGSTQTDTTNCEGLGTIPENFLKIEFGRLRAEE